MRNKHATRESRMPRYMWYKLQLKKKMNEGTSSCGECVCKQKDGSRNEFLCVYVYVMQIKIKKMQARRRSMSQSEFAGRTDKFREPEEKRKCKHVQCERARMDDVRGKRATACSHRT